MTHAPESSLTCLLVVDDSATTRKMIMTALRPLNPTFREASSGLEAIEQLMIGHFDAVTLDLNMPDMHGLEFLRFIRSHPAFGKIPVVIVTTRGGDDIRAQALESGANGYLTKPFSPDEILATVSRLLESGHDG
jgi:two-component system, chemotaxis family, chemotaxis protein CheY